MSTLHFGDYTLILSFLCHPSSIIPSFPHSLSGCLPPLDALPLPSKNIPNVLAGSLQYISNVIVNVSIIDFLHTTVMSIWIWSILDLGMTDTSVSPLQINKSCVVVQRLTNSMKNGPQGGGDIVKRSSDQLDLI